MKFTKFRVALLAVLLLALCFAGYHFLRGILGGSSRPSPAASAEAGLIMPAFEEAAAEPSLAPAVSPADERVTDVSVSPEINEPAEISEAPTVAPSPEISPSPPVPSLPAISPEPLTAWPVRLYIPAISVDAEIQDVGIEINEKGNETMGVVPSASVVSWLRERAIPGNEGNAFLAGHNRWQGERGQLLELDSLQIGDEMTIEYSDGTRLSFLMESVFVYALETAPAGQIMAEGGEARVTVITCKDPYNPSIGTSDNRIVAVFKEENVYVRPNPPITPFPTEIPE
ncbi:MAG: class F sortase [Clostridiales bacterium]|jgi:sortase (surface protein transpeptidase)|nr:class F sortase [Clostridiales bacterium]